MARATRVALVTGLALVAVVGGALVVVPPLLFSDGVDYSHAASIKKSAEYQDAALLERAWALPVAAIYRKDGVDYQGNGSFCGPTSAVNVLRSLGDGADQAHVLDGTDAHPHFGMLFGGITLDRLADVVRMKSGKRVTVLRDLTLDRFRAEIARSNDPALRYIVNFHRGPLFATGGGHHSPIGGYLADRDLVLVVDVNRKYQPWLVPTARLFEAVDTVDKSTGKKRGLLRIE
ncbi:MAG TPA: phytochelatin synthase family protein [Polyangia bacterium]